MFNHRYLGNIAVMAGIALFAVACASVTPSAKYASQSPNDNSNSESPPATTTDSHVDVVQDAWAKQHAAYLRSLDFATIDTQKNVPAAYTIKSDIIDTRYHVRNSETDLTVDHDVRSALRELRSAKHLFDRAEANADKKELNLLGDSKSALDNLIKQTELSMQSKCDSPGRSDYQLLERKLETLLVSL